jgi:hypothetical protein
MTVGWVEERRRGAAYRRVTQHFQDNSIKPCTVMMDSVTFSRDAFLFWMQNPKKKRERKLTLNIPSPYQDIYTFCPLYPSTYQFRFKYSEFREGIEELYRWIEPTILQNLWTGKVLTPLVDIQLILS